MKKNTVLVMSIISALLLIGSFPIRSLLGTKAGDIIRIMGFALLIITTYLRNTRGQK